LTCFCYQPQAAIQGIAGWGTSTLASFFSILLGLHALTLLRWCDGEHPDILSITAWYGNSSSQDRRVVRSAECTIGTTLPTLQDLYSRRSGTRACRIMKDLHHPNNKRFQLLQSGKRLRSHAATTERLKQRFFLQVIRTVNSPGPPTAPPMHTLTYTHAHIVST